MLKSMRTSATVLALACLLAVLAQLPAAAVSWEARFVAADRTAADFFGEAVAISDGTIVVGAKLQDAGGFDRGAAYVFVGGADGWLEEAKLTASDAANSDHFGTSVAVSGDTVVVGAPMDDDHGTSSGSAYVFSRSAGVWTQVAKLTAPDAALGDEFGVAVAVMGDTVLVGARRDDDRGPDSGSVYAFRPTAGGWALDAKLVPVDGQPGDLFGHSLAASSDTAVISAFGDDDRAVDAGAAYLFTRAAGGWSLAHKVTAPDGAAGDLFGHGVSVSADTAVISAFGDDDVARDSGSAYVLRRVGGVWEHDAKLRAADPAHSSAFGRAVAIDGNAAIVGASLDDALARDAGAVYAFERRGGQWVQTGKRTAPDGSATDLLGHAVALEGATGVVGAPLDDDRAHDTGSVWVLGGLADLTAPVIVAEVEPPPNAAGWHAAVPVRITFTCTDAGSGIATCTAPVSSSEEPGGTVTGTAVDQVGHSASLDVAVQIDLTPPVVTVDDPSPVLGVPFLASAVTGTTSDALSGIGEVVAVFTNLATSAQQTRIATMDGDSWTVSTQGLPPGPTSASISANDVAGNPAPAATLMVVVPPTSP